ncbi:MAG: hypothetical protein K1X57_19510 [Gemmataceae bacterium]|nr:hypothetical protein [Gemmataceae bacterium]
MRFLPAMLLLAMLTPGAARASDYGTHALRSLLHKTGYKPVRSVDEAKADPGQTIIILLGDCNAMLDRSFSNGRLRGFLQSGGAVLVATDHHCSRTLFPELEVQVDGDHVYGDSDCPETLYRAGLIDFPLLQPSIREEVRGRIKLLGDLERVATCRPSFLRRYEPLSLEKNDRTFEPRRVFAELPRGCLTRTGRDHNELREKRLMFGMAGEYWAGRYVVLADHSVFVNSLMLQTDNDNVAFAARVTSWLSESGQRKNVLLVEDGSIRTEFDLNLDYIDPPLPHPDVLGPAADQLISKLEADDFFNRTILQLAPLNRMLRTILLIVSSAATAYVLYRITSGKHRPDPSSPRLPDNLADLPGQSAPTNDSAVAARELVRASFIGLLGKMPARVPQVQAADRRTRRTWAGSVRSLWRVAVGERMTPLSGDLPRLAGELSALEEAVRSGVIRLSTGDTA